MPIRIDKDLPAFKKLTGENVFVIPEDLAVKQDIRPLKVAILNLMPTTVDTEIQILRLLGNTPLQVDICLLNMGSHESHNAPPGHLERFYINSKDAFDEYFDGMIITGAPVETLSFEDVDYWQELTRLFDYSAKKVFSTMHICWGAQAALYHRYGIKKIALSNKLFGVFAHNVNERLSPLFRGFDDIFLSPQSRHTESDRNSIASNKKLKIQSCTPCGSPFIVTARNGREIYITGHLEYDALTLDGEYKRDKEKGLPINIPTNYYLNDDPKNKPFVRWRAHAHLFFSNWINYVYQQTPFDISHLSLNNSNKHE
ncbi:MAG: homoserine O-succinyltransferase [Termitinemataceae bacterium]|nr:MAG: homoserine O-succinyltransferase [Termitinemataceae bacterium]